MKIRAKKVLAFLLTTVMMATLLLPAQADDLVPAQTAPAATVEDVTLPVSEKVELTSDAAGDSQWQICAGDDLWVDISGANQAALQLSYSMVANLLTDGTTAVRCKTTNGDQVTYGTEYQVMVDFDAVPQFEPAPQPDPATLVVSEAQAADTATGETAAPAPATAENALPANSALMAPMMAAPNAAPQAEGDGEDVKPQYTITINYLFENGTQAADPWVGEYAAGEAVDTITVKSPEVLGYQADQTEISLAEEFPDGINQNETITVTYRPAQVDFTVKYYEQNLNDDNYTLVETITKQGYTESKVGDALASEKDGFYALLYDTETPIAADGSTVVEIYYDRYYYLMTFDLGGGYGVEPIYARYGAPIEVGTPTRPGYSFLGWQLNDESATPPAAMPAENRNYVAQWQAADQAKVTIVFWGENADDEEYSYLSSKEIYAKPGTEYTYDLATPICGKEEHTHTEECIQCTHKHTLDCYDVTGQALGVGFKETTKPERNDLVDKGHGIWTYTENVPVIGSITYYYLELNGKWYCGDSFLGAVSEITYNCPHQQHDASCYVCGKEEHTHTADCYPANADLDSRLWRFVRSDTVTVAADGSSIVNVYFDRTTFTMHFRKLNSRYDDYGTITDKWGANIGDRFIEKCETADSYMWSRTSGSNTYTSYEEIMPQEDRTYYANYGRGESTATYYIQNLDGTGYTVKARLTANSATVSVTDEDRYPFVGFTINLAKSTKNGQSFDGAKFYYDRNSYTLKFFNNGQELSEHEKTLKYQEPLKGYYFEPEYPSNLEPGAYEFGGWYNAPYFTEDSRVDFDSDIMPANDLMLYANWVPVSHTVTFHLDSTENGLGTQVGTAQTIPHGEMLAKDSVPTKETLQAANNGQYEKYDFVGWFYKDEEGNEKAFDPDNMPVNRDLDLYAKWSSNVLMEYTIHYVYVDKNGERVTIADDTTGSALAGTTKTFDAKAGSQLYTGYQEGYFPKTNSHSLTIDIDNAENNVYTFEYVQKPFVWYTVQYINEETDEPLADEKKVSSSNAVVTETYQYIEGGWMPDAYQKRLVLAASEAEDPDEARTEELAMNIIKFYYHKDDKHAPVHVMHMLQNIEGDGYTLYEEYTDLEQIIDTTFSADILTDIDGAEFDHATANGEPVAVEQGAAQVTAQLGKEGLELILYYNRIEYPYKFKFVDKDTGEEIADPTTGVDRYGAQVTENAKDIPGYALADGEPDSKAIVIQKEDGQTAVKNVAVFYYVKSTASLTITKSTSGSNYDGEPFLFHVIGDGVDLDVLVPGNGSVTIDGLQVGKTYTVTEDESWAWRYNVTGNNTVTIDPNGSTITFTNTAKNDKWFDHTTSAENQWSNGEVSRVGEENQ